MHKVKEVFSGVYADRDYWDLDRKVNKEKQTLF